MPPSTPQGNRIEVALRIPATGFVRQHTNTQPCPPGVVLNRRRGGGCGHCCCYHREREGGRSRPSSSAPLTMQPGSWTLLLLPLAALLAPCRADALGDAISELPECMVGCRHVLRTALSLRRLLTLVPRADPMRRGAGVANPCHSLANTTCLCASVVNLYSDLQSCLSPTCTGMDTISEPQRPPPCRLC